MVFINLLSQLPLFPIRDPSDLVRKNQISLVLGIGLYLAVGALVYFKKLPLADRIPDKRYLLLVVAVDLILYLVVHRFQYGSFPCLNVNSLQKSLVQQNPPHHQVGGGGHPSAPHHQKRKRSTNQPKNKKMITNQKSTTDDLTSETINLDDDLESCLKKPGKSKQPAIHLKDQDTEYPLPTEFPEEASIPGRIYFKDDESQAVVDNWDIDEFTHEEYVPDRLSAEPNLDEFMSN